MDPNANWKEAVRVANALLDEQTGTDDGRAERLAELVVALDQWVRSGGFVPKPFER